MKAPSERLARAIGHRFNRPELLEQALIHRSAGRPNNERLEFLGDALLGLVVAEELYDRFAGANEGQLSRLRASLVKKESLAELARVLELGAYLSLGPGELRSGGQSRDSILADALEALLAAVYRDAGFAVAKDMILVLFQERLRQVDLEAQKKDPKTRLQEHLQAQGWPLPEYRIIEVTGSEHEQRFRVECRGGDGKEAKTVGEGTSRKRAEQDAAQRMLRSFENAR